MLHSWDFCFHRHGSLCPFEHFLTLQSESFVAQIKHPDAQIQQTFGRSRLRRVPRARVGGRWASLGAGLSTSPLTLQLAPGWHRGDSLPEEAQGRGSGEWVLERSGRVWAAGPLGRGQEPGLGSEGRRRKWGKCTERLPQSCLPGGKADAGGVAGPASARTGAAVGGCSDSVLSVSRQD